TATIVMDPAVPPAVPPPGEAIIAMVDNPIGRMASDNEISRISDGIMVAAGESSPAFQYDTYTNDPDRTEDWIGYQYSETRSFSALTFQEGLHFSDGGWFETLSVQ